MQSLTLCQYIVCGIFPTSLSCTLKFILQHFLELLLDFSCITVLCLCWFFLFFIALLYYRNIILTWGVANKDSDACYTCLYVITFPDNINANVFLCSRAAVATTVSDRIEIDVPSKDPEPLTKLSPSSVYWSSGVVMDGCYQMTEYVYLFERYKRKSVVFHMSFVLCSKSLSDFNLRHFTWMVNL